MRSSCRPNSAGYQGGEKTCATPDAAKIATAPVARHSPTTVAPIAARKPSTFVRMAMPRPVCAGPCDPICPGALL